MPDPERIPLVGQIYKGLTPSELDQVPIFGEVHRSLNALIDFYEYGCFPTWTVWVDTLFPALGKAILQLLDFGMGDIVRGYFRPTNLRGVGGMTRVPIRKRGLKAGKTATIRRYAKPPEIGNAIGRSLPGSQMFQARKVTGIERVAWMIDMRVQQALWYWLVADISEDFIINWTTAIMESEACRKGDNGHVSATRTSAQPMVPDTWAAFINWHVISVDPPSFFAAGSGGLTIPAGQKAHVTFWADSFANLPNTNAGAQIRVGVLNDADPANLNSPWPVTGDDDPKTPTLTGTIVGPKFVQAMIQTHGSGIQFGHNARLTATLTDA